MDYDEICSKYFKETTSVDKVFCPYRVCPIGAHVDHQFGTVSGFALNEGIYLYYKPIREAMVELYSVNFKEKNIFEVKRNFTINNDWGDYAKAAMNALFNQGYELKRGFYGVIIGTLPIGGLD